MYTISSDGKKFAHPDEEVLTMLAKAITQSSVRPIEVRFSYHDSQRAPDSGKRVQFFCDKVASLQNVHITCTCDANHSTAEDMTMKVIDL